MIRQQSRTSSFQWSSYMVGKNPRANHMNNEEGSLRDHLQISLIITGELILGELVNCYSP